MLGLLAHHAEHGIICLWGDHGWHLGEKEHWSKFALWESTTRVPLLFHVPGITAAGSECVQPVSLVDIYPTLMALCNLEAPHALDGLDISPLLSNPNLRWERPAFTWHGKDNVAVRDATWRYIHYRDSSKELYDHRVDPNEWNNLAHGDGTEKHIETINRLHRWIPKKNAAMKRLSRNRVSLLRNKVTRRTLVE